jgi:predicted oxidoreductase
MRTSRSRLISGLWRVHQWGMDPGQLAGWVNACLDLGIDTFDVADIYGNYQCESIFGAALKSDPALKSRIRVISKCGIALLDPSRPVHRVKHYNSSYEHIIASVENSLTSLGVERLEMLLIHRPDPLMNGAEVAKAFDRLRRDGKVEEFGVSNFLPHQFDLLQSCLNYPLRTNQVQVSLLHPDCLFDGTLDQCQRLGITPQAWSPLAGGALSKLGDEVPLQQTLARISDELGLTHEQLAIAWLLRHPAGMAPIVGTGKLERIRELVAAQSIVMDRQLWFELLEAAAGRPVP